MKNENQNLLFNRPPFLTGMTRMFLFAFLLCLSFSYGQAQSQETKKQTRTEVSDVDGHLPISKASGSITTFSEPNPHDSDRTAMIDAPDHNTTYSASNTGNSDYALDMTWDYNGSYCNCSQTTTLSVSWTQSGGNDFPADWLDVDTRAAIYKCGPGQSIDLDWSFNFYGERKWTGDDCTVFATCLVPCDCDYSFSGTGVTSSTSALKNPTSVSATDGEFDTKVVITWAHGSNVPAGLRQYRIYSDNVLIATINGSSTTYTHNGLTPGQNHNYTVKTYTPIGSFGKVHESSGASDQGSTFDVGLVVSDGNYYNRAKLSWNDISHIADDIRIERSIPESALKEELTILTGSAKAYNDQDGIPGYQYTYYVTPIGANPYLTDTDTGYSKPNGKVSGHVRSKLNAGVVGVEVNIELISTIPAGGAALPTCPLTYCAVTDAEGYYEIKDIYYYDGAEFEIVPFKMGLVPHEFSPDTVKRTLDVNTKTVSGVDFTDLTVYTVGGQITYPTSSNGSTCGIEGVTILVDSLDYGILTDAAGDWSFAIQEEKTYSFSPTYLHHSFENSNGDSAAVLFIAADNTSIDFEDTETDDLNIIVQGGCGASLGDSVEVQITSPNNCFNETRYTDVNGLLTLYDLPARDYSVQVTDIISPGNPNISNIMDQIGFKPVVIDLTVRDTAQIVTNTDTTLITPMSIDTLPNGVIITTDADTMMVTLSDTTYSDVAPGVTFIYRSPLVITTNWVDAGAQVLDCTNSEDENIILMEQGLSYVVQFEVKEILGEDCYIDTGFLKIYDFVSDREGTAIKVPIIGGIATYVIEAGEPIVAFNPTFHDHEKLLYIIPEVDLITPEPVEYWVFVTGAKSNTPSFITRTPDIPMIILHDPPGDQSYSFIEKGTSFTHFRTSEVQTGGEAGIYLDLLLGAKWLTPFSGNGFGTQIKFSAVGGRDNYDRDGVYTTITFNERFSTSDLENLTGHDGDVYIGAAFNQEFSIAELLTFNEDSCKGFVNNVPSIAVEDFATTFVYTEKHIKSTLLPTIGFIKDNILDGREFSTLSVEDQAEVNNLIRDSLMWTQILEKNRIHRDSLASKEENISFSAGAPLSREYTNDTMSTNSYEYNSFFNSEFALGAKIDNESGIWFDSALGVMGKVRAAHAINVGDDTTLTRTIGYVLDDNDIGDFFSVDILSDTAYRVPAFKLKLGTSSCPQEPGTQARDRASIQILPPEQTNIPPGESANFICQVTNLSESFETREYAVRVIGTTNPDGLIVTLAGQWIGSGDGTFFLERGQTSNLNLSFEQGPLANLYENIGIMIYPPCEYELWQDNGNLTNSDTAYIKRIEWQSQCTNASLSLPDDGWLVNQQSNNMIHAAFAGYDTNNELFESITLQIKKEGEGYVDQITILKDDLIGPFYDVFLDVSNFPDGNYRLRAKAFCGPTGGITYSSEKSGTIDRNSLAPFGTPSPSDGFLREGQEVSVSFDKFIDCDISNYANDITLIREDTGMPIPFTVSCYENQIIINTTPPLIDQTDLDGVTVTAHVSELRDLNGNVQEYPTDWSFLVNVSPVFWDPADLYMSGYDGEAHTMTATLKNTSLLSKAFSLEIADNPSVIEYPTWLKPLTKRGSILSNNQNTVQFAVDTNLLPGIYTGVVSALVDGLPVSMNVTFELLAKPVNWPFNADQYQYSMTVVAQFSLDASDTNLSSDSRDLVGAFVGGQIRGVSNIEYIPSLNVYRAFLTVYSNVLGGGGAETVNFRFWRALTGVEYSAVEEVTFVLDKTTGSVENPLILHPIGFHQVIPLNKGWNWISLNLEADDMSKEQIFLNLLNSPSGNVITVKSKAQTTTYSPSSNWSGNLSDLQLGPGYLVHLSNAPDTLRVAGLPSPSTIVLGVSGSWNWIGFPRLEPEPVDIVLTNLNAAVTGDILKSQSQFSAFEASTNSWLGNLKFFNPGKGYKLNLQNPGTIIFDASRGDGFETDPYKYEYNMNINGAANLVLIGEEKEEDLIVGAFVDNECRGTGYLEYNAKLHDWRVVMLVNGNAEDIEKEIEFRFKNETSGSIYVTNGEQLSFAPDAIEGTIEQPYQFFQGTTAIEESEEWEYSLEQSRPNPTSGMVEIGFQVPEKGKVQMTLFDMDGNEILRAVDKVLTPGRHVVKLDLTALPVGLYYYELHTSKFSGVKKLVKQ